MTVSYNLDVSSVTTSSFFKLLFRWRGSIWKSIITELIIWLCCYYTVFCIYRFALNEESQGIFEKIAAHCDKKLHYIPLQFMLAFFVAVVIDRWRKIFNNMGWIENVALTVSCLIRGDTKDVILTRRAIVRYLVLAQVLVFRDISMRVRRRFPNMESIVTAGFLHEEEKRDLEKIKIVYNKYWAPINWALTLCFRMHTEGHIAAVSSLNVCITEIKAFRTSLSRLCNFDWVPVPIAYPQVVFLAVRVYFMICLISRQYIIGETAANKSVIDLYVPFMTILQFIFFVGWMKTGLSIVDETHDYSPLVLPDRFMDPHYAPVYSEASQKRGHDNALLGSAEGIKLVPSNENVKMVSVSVSGSPNCHLEIPSEPRSRRAEERRKFSETLRLGQPRSSYAVQPVHLRPAAPVTDSKTPNQFFTPFELSNGFEPSKTIPPEALQKVDEEDILGSDQQPQQINRIRSTTESANETEIPAIIRKDLGLEKRKDEDDKEGAETPDE